MDITEETQEQNRENFNIDNPFINHGIKEFDLVGLGFVKIDVPFEETGDDDFYYYRLYIGDICLITNSDDEIKDDKWSVEVFDFESISFTGIVDLRLLIDLLKRNTIK